ncbi:hypothetical protein [Fructobacillus papyrifericola]|uniref:Uncharacterized protein n=1 Tax=Fructobacillus papyrifericola TaxID=2713172 RepID=A0ABS5QUB6_9LACO|nr:hypothetical protein [Fructobacillus papyrifericola]MBS9335924.1 hypothetical protein [Fructobacillus papyrifericola]
MDKQSLSMTRFGTRRENGDNESVRAQLWKSGGTARKRPDVKEILALDRLARFFVLKEGRWPS